MAHRLLTAARRLDRLLQKVKKTGSVDPNAVSEVFLLEKLHLVINAIVLFRNSGNFPWSSLR